MLLPMKDQPDRGAYAIGPVLVVTAGGGIEGLGEFTTLAFERVAVAQGLLLSPLEREMVRQHFTHEAAADVKSIGFPEIFRRLFACETFKKAKTLLDGVVVTGRELMGLRYNCDRAGLRYRTVVTEHVPESLRRTDEEREAFFSNGPGVFSPKARRFARKVSATFSQRKSVNVHMLDRPDGSWFCIYGTIADVRGLHWNGQAHMHYVASTWWKQHTSDQFFASLQQRQWPGVRSIHMLIERGPSNPPSRAGGGTLTPRGAGAVR